MLIQATPIAMTSKGCDKIAWADSLQGIFSLRSAYRIVMGHEESSTSVLAGYGKQTPFQELKHFFGCVLTIVLRLGVT